jgi:hypothetical protein
MFDNVDVLLLVIDIDFGPRPSCDAGEFEAIADVLGSRWFQEVPVLVLVLHKERFEAAVAAWQLGPRFPEHDGGADVTAGQSFV